MHTMCDLCTLHSAFNVSSFGYRLLALKYNKLIFRVDPFASTDMVGTLVANRTLHVVRVILDSLGNLVMYRLCSWDTHYRVYPWLWGDSIHWGGTLFASEQCPRGTLFTSEYCPRGHYSLVNNVWGDILWGDTVHYDNGSTHVTARRKGGSRNFGPLCLNSTRNPADPIRLQLSRV